MAKVKQSADALDAAAYAALAKPSSKHPVTYYSTVEPDLFDKIIAKYDSGMAMAAMAAQVGRRRSGRIRQCWEG